MRRNIGIIITVLIIGGCGQQKPMQTTSSLSGMDPSWGLLDPEGMPKEGDDPSETPKVNRLDLDKVASGAQPPGYLIDEAMRSQAALRQLVSLIIAQKEEQRLEKERDLSGSYVVDGNNEAIVHVFDSGKVAIGFMSYRVSNVMQVLQRTAGDPFSGTITGQHVFSTNGCGFRFSQSWRYEPAAKKITYKTNSATPINNKCPKMNVANLIGKEHSMVRKD